MNEKRHSGLIIPDKGLAVPPDVLIESLKKERDELLHSEAELRAQLGKALEQIELYRRRLGEGPFVALPPRAERRRRERALRKADLKERA